MGYSVLTKHNKKGEQLMKRFALLLLMAAIFAFAGCQGDSSESETETPKETETDYHKVSFVSDSETTIEPQTVENGKTATEPSKPTKTGYTFSAWYDGERAFDFSTPITKDTTLTAKWTANTYTVTLSNNGGESQVSVTFGEKFGDLESVPSMANSSFGGFYTEEYAKGTKFIGADGKGCKAYDIASDTTLYAAWGYRISYENLKDAENPNPEIYTGEEDVALADLENIMGFAFAGWYDAETDGNKVETIAKGESGAKTLYARWTEVSYTVKHFLQNVDDGEYTEAENEKETFPGKIGNSTEAAEKTFTGFTAKTIEQKTIEMEGTVANVYYDRNLYEVTFNAKGGTPVASTQIRYGAKPTEPTTTRFPYDFLGWYTSSDEGETLAETAFDFDSETFSNLTLYAKWYLDISNCTATDAAEKIREMKESGNVVIKGEISNSTIKEIAKAISEKDSTIRIALDLSDTTDLSTIEQNAFYGCTSLTSIELPSSVTLIVGSAFHGCKNLASIEIPDGVTYIGSSAFYGCENLASIEIPDGVTYIGYDTFYGCHSLTRIVIPDSVTSIGSSAFFQCNELTSIVIPDSVTYIGKYAFVSCFSLKSIVIPSGVTSIGDYVFNFCPNLKSIVIPDGVTSIGDSAFSNCSRLTSIEIPSNVTSIGDYAFSCCVLFTSIEIPSNVTSIGKYAFNYCRNLTSLTFLGTRAEWNNITKGENWNKDVPATEVVCSDGVVHLK